MGFISLWLIFALGYERFFEWFYTEMGYFDWLVQILGNTKIGLNLEVRTTQRGASGLS